MRDLKKADVEDLRKEINKNLLRDSEKSKNAHLATAGNISIVAVVLAFARK